MDQERVIKSRKRKGPGGRAVIIILGMVLFIMAAVLIVYAQMGRKYNTVFFPNTVINGIDVSGKTVEETKRLISAGVEGYVLTLVEREGKTEQITAGDIGLYTVFDGSLENFLEEQEPNDWLKHKYKPVFYQTETMINYQEDKFNEVLEKLECLDELQVTKPENAKLSEYVPGEGYTVIPEILGNQVKQEILAKEISAAVLSMKENLTLEEINCYEMPEIQKDNEELVNLAALLNKYTGVNITYQFGDRQEVLSGDTINSWLTVNADYTVPVDREKAAAYIKDLASKYDTAYKTRNLKTASGATVTIKGGHYGWKINQKEETDELLKIIQSGQSQTREPVYSQKAASHGANDYGDTYVEINLTAQHLYFYKDGKLVVESDFVSGNLAKGYGTPAGSFPLTYKQRNAVLKGEDYRTPVDYWMPFNGGIGLHDATWRNKFGGVIYKTGGSHGCVNLPHNVAKTIYEGISAGDPVLCYNLEGTEKKETSPGKEKPAETTAPPVTAAPPETTAPPATAAPEPSTAAVPETTETPETTKAPETSGAAGPGGSGASSGNSTEVGPGIH